MPNEEEIRKIMAKAEKASGGKGPPHKKVKEKPNSGGTKEKPLGVSPKKEKSISEKTPTKEEKKPEPAKPSPEVTELKDLVVKQNQIIEAQNGRIANIENFLKEAQKQAQAQMANQTGQGTSQEKETQEGQADQGKDQQEITPEQEVAMLQDAQRRAQPGQEGQPPAGAGNPLYIYLLGKTMDTVGKVLPAALQRGGGAGGEGGGSFSQVAEALVLEWLKKSFAGGGGGGDQNISVEQMKTMSNFQGMLLGSFFNTIKNLPKPMAEKIIEGAIKTPGGTEELIK